MDINNPHLFDAEKDYMATKVPDELYEYPEDRVMYPKYTRAWRMLLSSSIRQIFGTSSIPKIATEEHIEELKIVLKEMIDERYNKPERKRIVLYGEETEPSE